MVIMKAYDKFDSISYYTNPITIRGEQYYLVHSGMKPQLTMIGRIFYAGSKITKSKLRENNDASLDNSA